MARECEGNSIETTGSAMTGPAMTVLGEARCCDSSPGEPHVVELALHDVRQ